MGNIFTIPVLGSSISQAKDKATVLAAEMGLSKVTGGRVLPVLPPYPKNGSISINVGAAYENGQDVINVANSYNLETVESNLNTEAFNVFGFPMCFPLWVKKSVIGDRDYQLRAKVDLDADDYWLLPIEPMITLGGGNTLIKRNVSKRGNNPNNTGTIKEKWSADDFSITISGLLSNIDDWTYPANELKALNEFCQHGLLDVKCELLNYLNIRRVAIERFDIPFTKGEENQAYTINGYSDSDWELFIEI
jgi:hypothetical protein